MNPLLPYVQPKSFLQLNPVVLKFPFFNLALMIVVILFMITLNVMGMILISADGLNDIS